jgi:hypothetical protein
MANIFELIEALAKGEVSIDVRPKKAIHNWHN